jgi:transposase
MPRGANCEISSEIRNLIILNYEEERRIADIAEMFHINYNSVTTIIRRYNQHGSIEIKARRGRPKKVTHRRENLIIREMKKNRRSTKCELLSKVNDKQSIKISTTTLKRVLNKNGYSKRIARKKPFVSVKNKMLRKKWAKAHLYWSIYKWKQVLWTDECHVEHDNQRNVLVWRRAGEEWLTDCLKGTVKSGRFSITIWSCVGWKGAGPIRIIKGRLNSEKYKNLLEDVWPEIIETFGENILFQDDNATIHRARSIQQWKDENGIKSIDWTPQSPDLNIIENVWSVLKRALGKMDTIPSSIEILEKRVVEVWSEISATSIQNLVKSMPKRCLMVIKKKGSPTKY